MLITEEYKDLNKGLHAGGAYGVSSARWAGEVMRLRREFGAETVLDYGCGQGRLGDTLGNPKWLREYDPCIAGKDGKPERADMVVCTDVLEHIEPDCLADVLRDIRHCAKKIAFLNISTRPAVKTLPDGRNAHLIVEPAGWWEEKLSPYFQIQSWDVGADELTVVVARQIEIGELTPVSAVSEEIRGEQTRDNLAKCQKRVAVLPPNNLTAALCCYGPSMQKTWKELDPKRQYICTVSGSHDLLIKNGIIPDAHVECDPREHKSTYTENPHPDVQYMIASCCHPKLIDQLADSNLALWHVGTDVGSMEALQDLEPGAIAIAGGGSVGLRALNVLYVLGFRRFVIYGMDCSFADDGEQHAGDHAGKRQSESPVRCGDRWFKSSLTMVSYARYFFKAVRQLNDQAKLDGNPMLPNGEYVDIKLSGDGLLQSMAIEAQLK